VTPFVVCVVVERLQGVIVAGSETAIDKASRCALRLGGTEIRRLEDRAKRALGCNRIFPHVFPIAPKQAAKILRPRPVHCSVDDDVTYTPGTQILRLGRGA